MAASGPEYEKFNPFGDVSTLGVRWRRWLRGFELMAESKNVSAAARKRAMLLHYAGPEVQDIYFALPADYAESSPDGVVGTVASPGRPEDEYAKAVKILNRHFDAEVNTPYERYKFAQISQGDTETVDEFVIRLRQQIQNTGWQGKQAEEAVRDKLVAKCCSSELRVKLLTEASDLTLTKALDIARRWELTTRQSRQMSSEVAVNAMHTANKQWSRNSGKRKTPKKGECYRCGLTGHYASDKECPAKEKECNKCGLIGHFSKCCKTKASKIKSRAASPSKRKVRNVSCDNESDCESSGSGVKGGYTFSAKGGSKVNHDLLKVKIGSVPSDVLIDSGATVNVIDKEEWERLKSEKVKCISYLTNQRLYVYGSDKPVTVVGAFKAGAG
ncbi:uncharacterized protein LOC124172511 [Ischnura elegans]|uniref:uncharacterized protein LOC124172511 n=1 Tax=Ischnura elegans TaxID=197161 RepID=UPI001ED88618|nr:uncharacterized protein LOC124172511 [Ischnura elegans]